MNSDDLLEHELRRLRPHRLPARLSARIAAELAATETARPSRRRVSSAWSWPFCLAGGLALAAGLVVAFVALRPAAGTATPEVATLVALDEEGIVTSADGQPARQVRIRYLDTYSWRDPRTNASLEWSEPREEVRLIPIAFN